MLQCGISDDRLSLSGQVRLRENIAEIYGTLYACRGRPTDPQIKELGLYESQVKNFASEINVLNKTGLTKSTR
jgi:hypothetical protein